MKKKEIIWASAIISIICLCITVYKLVKTTTKSLLDEIDGQPIGI